MMGYEKSQEMWRDTDFRIKDSQLNGTGCVYESERNQKGMMTNYCFPRKSQ
jgi:hypothetical protein